MGALCLSLFVCYALLCGHSSFAFILKRNCYHLEEEEKAGCFAIIVSLQKHSYYKCSVALPQGTLGWSAVCDCSISGSYSLTLH